MAPRFRLPKKKCVTPLVSRAQAKKMQIVGTIKSGSAILRIACPKRQLARNGRCKVGTVAVEEINAARRGRCPVHYRRK